MDDLKKWKYFSFPFAPDTRKSFATFELSRAALFCPTGMSSIRMEMYGDRWNDADGSKPKCSNKNLYHCQFVHHKLAVVQVFFSPIFYI